MFFSTDSMIMIISKERFGEKIMTLACESKIAQKFNTKKVCHCKWVATKDEPSKLIAQWICDDIIVMKKN